MLTRDLLPFPSRTANASDRASLNILASLRELVSVLADAIRFAEVVSAKRDGVPELFFFHSPNVKRSFGDTPAAIHAARKYPDLAFAWASLRERIDDAFTLAAANVQVRHMARAVPQMQERLRKLSNVHEQCRHFANLLDVIDDEVITVLDGPRTWRVHVRGIADLGQFHILLADQIAERRPDPRHVEAYRFGRSGGAATIHWQFHKPGKLVPGFAGHTNWLWETQPLKERTVLLGPPVYPRQWLAERKFAAVAGELEVIETVKATKRQAA